MRMIIWPLIIIFTRYGVTMNNYSAIWQGMHMEASIVKNKMY